jgi:hypothetical protein
MSGIGDISIDGELKQAIAMHLDELAKSLDGYFPTRESYPYIPDFLYFLYFYI